MELPAVNIIHISKLYISEKPQAQALQGHLTLPQSLLGAVVLVQEAAVALDSGTARADTYTDRPQT